MTKNLTEWLINSVYQAAILDCELSELKFRLSDGVASWELWVLAERTLRLSIGSLETWISEMNEWVLAHLTDNSTRGFCDRTPKKRSVGCGSKKLFYVKWMSCRLSYPITPLRRSGACCWWAPQVHTISCISAIWQGCIAHFTASLAHL